MPRPRFQNLDDVPHLRGLGSVLRWKLGLGPEAPIAPPVAPPVPVPRVVNDGRALRDAPVPSLTWIGHATYLAQLAGRSVLTDPILSSRIFTVPREVPPGLEHSALPKIHIVTVSHNHYDHMDRPTLLRLGPDVHYVVPRGLGTWFRRNGLPRVTELDWWRSTKIDGLEVTLVPSQHWSRRGLFDTDATLWGGFVIRGGGHTVYHSGDTAYFSGFREIGARLGPIDAAMLPIGAYEPRWFMKAQHMNPDDAVQAFEDLQARRFFAMHWGTFKLTDEPLDEPPRRTRVIWAARRLDPDRLVIPAVGETVRL